MHSYGVADVERLLGLSRATVRALVDAGFVKPHRGPRNTMLFSFQDLIALRTAQALAKAKVPARRITRSLKELRGNLPDEMPLSGLRIGAEGDRVVVREGATRRDAESGQYLLEFEGDPQGGALTVIEPRASPGEAPPLPAQDDDLDAYIDRGMALHEEGRLEEARTVYARALEACGPDATLLFNTGVLLEDLRRIGEAMQAYRAAIEIDASFADAHYNLALLCRRAGRAQEAIRHMSHYRRLTAPGKA
jgi:tetratricopeptide (TPR) repeat protein